MQKKEVLTVNTPSRNYKILIGAGIIGRLGKTLKALRLDESCFVVSSPRVFSLYGKKVTGILRGSGIKDVGVGLFPDGEKNKSWKNYEKILSLLISFDGGKKKRITVIALGGGVVGDLAGFVASTYRRGVPFVPVPTTFLAAVDSSVGGKTGIDFIQNNRVIKNIVGQIYQPSLVLTDLSFFKTLPKREFLSGIAEVIKYGIIKDRRFFEYLESHKDEVLSLNAPALGRIVRRSCEIKSDIVERDERETKGIRTILNYGHTVGHAVESVSCFRYTHGEAISIGMAAEGRISNKSGYLPGAELERIKDIIQGFGLPVQAEGCPRGDLLKVMMYDKKFHGGRNLFVLPVRIGKVIVKRDIDENIIRACI